MTDQIAILMNLLTRYEALAATAQYILGFVDRGIVYAAYVTADVLPYVCTVSIASRGHGYALRFRPTAAQKMTLLPYAQVVCSEAYFKAACADSKYNKGEIFEKIITEAEGQRWEKDSRPFTQCGDINIGGVEYQIKFQNATFTDEKILYHMEQG